MKLFVVAVVLFLVNTVAHGFDITTSDCGGSFECIRYPSSCSGTTGPSSNCNALIKWKSVKSNGKNYLDIEMYGKGASTLMPYVSVAFSEDDDMPNNPYSACFRHTTLSIKIAWGYITTKTSPPIDIFQPAIGYITNTQVSLNLRNNIATVQCRYRRLMTLSNTKYQLKAGTKYYALGAYGVMSSTTVFRKHIHDFHSDKAMVLASGASACTGATLLIAAAIVSKLLL